MKKILITGMNSYIGNSFAEYTLNDNRFSVTQITVRGNEWQQVDFSIYDVVLHVAGIAHVSTNRSQEELYYKVNRDLTIAVAQKAKEEGVSQFVFLSSMIVYGQKNKKMAVSESTEPQPSDFYGLSKLQAEQRLSHLQSDTFTIQIIRPPMVYGKNSKGNFPKLMKFAQITPLFPKVDNKRSVIYIDNLCQLLCEIIIQGVGGIFHVQNEEYVCTSELVKQIAEISGKNVRVFPLPSFIITTLMNLSVFNKLFGDFYYDASICYKKNENQLSFRETLIRTMK